MQPQPQQDAASEIETLKDIVAKYFAIYETRMAPDSVSFLCRIDITTLDEYFRRLRDDLGRLGYTPVITYKGGEHIVTVGKLPKIKPKGIWVNIVMLALTIITTIIAGMILWKPYSGGEINSFFDYFDAQTILMGALTFALPLMGILAIHEMAHYLMARHHGIPASLPFFIPAPPPLPLGTFGAFISIRGPMPDRKTLFDLGVSGPIAGFLAAIPIAIIGLMLTSIDAKPVPEEVGGAWIIMAPLIYDFIELFLPMPGDYLLHPTAFAAWVGFLVTAINLLPAGTLDGGHIARAALGQNAKYISWAAVLGLFALGLFYTGWMLFALIILFLGIKHPPPLNDITLLKTKRKLVGIGVALILVISFAPIPFTVSIPDNSFDVELQGSDYGNISATMDHTFVIIINSTGNIRTELLFDLTPTEYTELSFEVSRQSSDENDTSNSTERIEFAPGGNLTINFTVSLNSPIGEDNERNLTIIIRANNSEFSRSIPVTVKEIAGSFELFIPTNSATLPPGGAIQLPVFLNSTSLANMTVDLIAVHPANWSAAIYIGAKDDNTTNRLTLILDPLENISCTIEIISDPSSSISEEWSIEIIAVSSDYLISQGVEIIITIG